MNEINKNCEKKKYKKKNKFKFNIIFNNNGEALESIIERAFENYCLKRSYFYNLPVIYNLEKLKNYCIIKNLMVELLYKIINK